MSEDQFAQLMHAIGQQTEAINRLSDTNAALIQALADEQSDDEDREPTTYLDGRPIS